MPENIDKLKPSASDIEKLLELELMQKRSSWQQAKGRRSVMRALSFLFLFLVIVGAAFTYLVYFSPQRVGELKARTEHSEPTPGPLDPPQ